MCSPVGDTWSAVMLKLFVRTAVAAVIVIAAGTVSPPLAQEPSLTIFVAASMKNALDDINAAFTKTDQHQDGRELRRDLRADAADRAGRAGGHLRLRRPRMDGLRHQEQAHQPEHAREPAGQPAGADRAEGFQDHDGQARAGLRPGQARRRRPHRHRRGEVGAGRPLRRGGDAEAWDVGHRSRSGWPWSRTCASRLRSSPAARPRSGSSTRPTPRWSPA